MRNTNITSPQPLISFIITTYNLPKQLLVEAIESAMNLTLSKKEREIIVVDDGSDTIDTLKDIQEIANSCTQHNTKNSPRAIHTVYRWG